MELGLRRSHCGGAECAVAATAAAVALHPDIEASAVLLDEVDRRVGRNNTHQIEAYRREAGDSTPESVQEATRLVVETYRGNRFGQAAGSLAGHDRRSDGEEFDHV
jgi:hypothetical protein